MLFTYRCYSRYREVTTYFMKKSHTQISISRSMLVLFLGMGVLLALAVGSLLIRRNAPAPAPRPALSVQAGPYTLAIFISPDPPLTGQMTHLTIHVTETATGQPVNNVGIELQGLMTSMDMEMGPFFGAPQPNGTYLVDVHLFMGGLWRFIVTITSYNAPTVSTLFELNSH